MYTYYLLSVDIFFFFTFIRRQLVGVLNLYFIAYRAAPEQTDIIINVFGNTTAILSYGFMNNFTNFTIHGVVFILK